MSPAQPPSRARSRARPDRPSRLGPLGLLGLLAAVALVLSSCGAIGASPAATVDGERLPDSRVADELTAIRGNAPFLANIESQTPVRGGADGTFDSAFVARVLSLQVYYHLMDRELARRGVEITAGDIDEVRQPAIDNLGGDEVFAGFPEWYQDELIRRQALFRVLNLALIEGQQDADAARRLYDERRDELEQVCARHILVETEPEAAGVLDRLEAGDDFATIAEEESLDPGSAADGGSLGCFDRETPFVVEFLEAAFALAAGEVSSPVETDFGFHVIEVTERRIPTFEQIRPELEERLQSESEDAFGAWLSEATTTSEIEVNPRYGSWQVDDDPFGGGPIGRVEPPDGPTTATTAPPDPTGF